MIAISIVLTVIVGPLLLGLTGLARARGAQASAGPLPPWNVRLTVSSTLLYALAFNLIFFIQELFLVLPKAFTPGLRPTLFHNNHSWEGEHPLASLFQGTGALAIFLVAAVCLALLRRDAVRSPTTRLLLIWMAYNGFLQSLSQVVIGAVNPRNDVGMAMEYLGLGATAKTAAALIALVAIPLIALWLGRRLLSLADDSTSLASAWMRTRFVFQTAALPGLLSIPLIVLFRVPRELIEVVLPPVVVTLVGAAWIQAGAWRMSPVQAGSNSGAVSIAPPLAAVLILLLVFQLLLRPGVAFYGNQLEPRVNPAIERPAT